MEKRKLIHVSQEHLIVCDNKKCDFKIENKDKVPNIETADFINAACPKCGETLLTYEDYITARKVLKIVDWLNKYFSWTMYLVTEKRYKKLQEKRSSIHVHNGINVVDLKK